MAATPPFDPDRTAETVGYAPPLPSARPVAREDWFWAQGPLGVMVLLGIVAVAILWKRLIAVEREADEKIAAKDKQILEMATSHAEQLEALTKEHAEQLERVASKGHELAGSLRDVLDAAKTRIVR